MGTVPIYFLHDDVDEVFEEKGNSFASLRKVQWAKEGDPSDPSKAKLEIRKWYITGDGERPAKGFTFLTEHGPDDLVHSLINMGYGNTKDILLSLKNRKDFRDSVEHLYDKETEEDDGEYFDARSALL